ncbi:MAG: hypothetical protein KY469_01870 [Actinobacteria bacterium]|nr:hypothetical protein [Actinomycetota bacterium]
MTATALALPLQRPSEPLPAPVSDRPLAPVIDLGPVQYHPDTAPVLRLTRRGKLAIGALLAGAALGLLALLGVGTGTAEPAAAVAGHVVVEPGQTLWDVAVAAAPAGSDPRAYLADLLVLNGFDGAGVPAWTVVLLPTEPSSVAP